jgi:hypothetical protein
MSTVVSEESITSMFRVENHPNKKIALPSHLLHDGFLLGRYSTLKVEEVPSSETSVHIRITRRYIPEGADRSGRAV